MIGSKHEQTDGNWLCGYWLAGMSGSARCRVPRDKLSALLLPKSFNRTKCSPGCLQEPSGGLQHRRGRLVPMLARYVLHWKFARGLVLSWGFTGSLLNERLGVSV
jgi:hypothetical protein